MMDRPRLIGIAGPSGSGKSTLAHRIADSVAEGAIVYCLDWYYHDRAGIPESDINVDIPEAIESSLLISHLGELATGHSIKRPVYDYAAHSRAAEGTLVVPAANIIVEGLFTLYWKELRDLLDLSIYIEADYDTCLARRIERDTQERSRTRESVIEMYESKVRPMYEAHVYPTHTHADLLLKGTDPIEILTARVMARLNQ